MRPSIDLASRTNSTSLHPLEQPVQPAVDHPFGGTTDAFAPGLLSDSMPGGPEHLVGAVVLNDEAAIFAWGDHDPSSSDRFRFKGLATRLPGPQEENENAGNEDEHRIAELLHPWGDCRKPPRAGLDAKLWAQLGASEGGWSLRLPIRHATNYGSGRDSTDHHHDFLGARLNPDAHASTLRFEAFLFMETANHR